MLAFVAIPLLLTLSQSFHAPDAEGARGLSLSLAQYREIFGDAYYRGIYCRTFALSVTVTFICVVIGVPEAYLLNRLSSRWRAVSMFVVLGPLLMSVVVRTLGWAVLFDRDGIVNSLLVGLGIVDEPVRLMFTFTGIVIALVHVQVPFMVLAVWTSLQKIDASTEQAAETLGASATTILWRIVFPQVIPGVLSGGLIVFALTASAFATPAIIGGRRLKVVPTTVYDEILGNLNWPLGTALAAVLMVAVLFISIVVGRYVERRYRQVF
ncbi:ABC transporter permease [Burkholderia sp. 22PA0106]|uniref:ABC transporter permease n=1 Tax=Burkholderia sp. 22PA0106 TaxID=3237371 RepID=UPI0039C419EB